MRPPATPLLAAFSAEPLAAAVPLRWAGALHHLALRGLAGLWPAQAAGLTELLAQGKQHDAASDGAPDAELDAAIAAAWLQLVEAADQRASARAPLAWLRFEPRAPDHTPELRCRLWPGGEDRLLARAHAHVRRIEWLA